MPAQQRRRCHHKPVTTPARERSRKRSDERPIGRSKPRTRLLTSENRQLVPQKHQLDILGELGSPIADEQPQDSSEGKVRKRKEHRPILPPNRLWAMVLARFRGFWYSRARQTQSAATTHDQA
jgi:hypothetical protein